MPHGLEGKEVKVFDTWRQDGSSFTDQGWQFFSCSKCVPEGAGIGINYFIFYFSNLKGKNLRAKFNIFYL